MAPTAKQLPYRLPKPFQFVLAVAGMGTVTGLALDAAGHGDVMPSLLLNGYIRAYVAPLGAILFGASWKTVVLGLGVLSWMLHLLETVYLWGYITGSCLASQGRWTVSTGVLLQYLSVSFLGGVTQIATCQSAIKRLNDEQQPKRD